MSTPDSNSTGLLSARLFVFAAAGVCLGLSDVWRFPFLLVEHGSAWFPVLYLAGIALLGVPLLVAELALVRLGHSHPGFNFGFRPDGDASTPLWQYAGIAILAAVFLILSYSTVVAAWMMAYTVRAAVGGLEELSVGAARLVFDSLITDPERLLGWHILFVLGLTWVSGRGVVQGLGRFSAVLVSGILVAGAVLAALSLYGFGTAPMGEAEFSFHWSSLSGALVLDAITQAFFTLGVCMGAMMILGSHLSGRAPVGRLVLGIVGLDILFVVLASAAALPMLAGGETAGPGISFAVEAVPIALADVPFGRVLMVLFFALLFMLVATTALVLMELLVSWVAEKSGRPRPAAVKIAAGAVWTGGLLALLSFSRFSFEFEFVGEERSFGLFDVMDILSSQILLPIIGFLMAVFVGWNVDREKLNEVIGRRAAALLYQLKRYLVPAAVGVIFIALVFGRVLPRV